MSGSLLEICDQFITRCNQVLAAKDNEAAKLLRADATRRFHALVPRWSAGLMASITNFYLDDIENILVKLTDFRKQLEKKGDRQVTAAETSVKRSKSFSYRRIDSSFEQTCAWIRECYAASATEKDDILERIGELQRIALSQETLNDKWDEMRSFIEWIRSKNADLAAHVLPLMAEALEQ